MCPTLDLSCEENAVWWKWRLVYATWTPESGDWFTLPELQESGQFPDESGSLKKKDSQILCVDS